MTRTTRPKSLVAALDKGVRDAGEDLSERDVPTIAAARAYATQVDAVLGDPDATPGERVKALHVLPHFVNACRMLGFNPMGREEIAKVRANAAEVRSRTTPPPSPVAKGSAKLRAVMQNQDHSA